MFVEDWPGLGDAAKAKAIIGWSKESINRAECRDLHKITEIYQDKSAPAMPCYKKREKMRKEVALSATKAAGIRGDKTSQRKKTYRWHAKKHAELGFCSEEFQAMINTAIAPEKANPTKGARKAVEKKWKTCLTRKLSHSTR